jgi:hypothetical protein
MSRKPTWKRTRPKPKAVLRLPDLDQAKSAVLNRLTSADAQRGYRRAIEEFVEWYCSEPRLSFSRTVVLRYRIHFESRNLAPGTINLRALFPFQAEPTHPCLKPGALPRFLVMKACKEKAEGDARSFDILVCVDNGGVVEEVLVYPPTRISQCLGEAILIGYVLVASKACSLGGYSYGREALRRSAYPVNSGRRTCNWRHPADCVNQDSGRGHFCRLRRGVPSR